MSEGNEPTAYQESQHRPGEDLLMGERLKYLGVVWGATHHFSTVIQVALTERS